MSITNVYYPTAWLTHFLDDLLGSGIGSAYVDLFITTSVFPSDSSVIGDFTLGSVGSAFPVQSISTWDAAALVGSVAWKYQTNPLTFTNGSGVSKNVYGWILFDGSGNPICVQRDANAPIAVANGATFKLTPGLAIASQF